jgi:hypothetical protein
MLKIKAIPIISFKSLLLGQCNQSYVGKKHQEILILKFYLNLKNKKN